MSAEKPSDTTRLDTAIREARRRALAAVESGDSLEVLAAETELRLLDRKRDLARIAVRLADTFLRLAERLEEDPMVSLNPLLMNGSDVTDATRACIEIGVLRQVLDDVERARRAAGPPTEPEPTLPTPRERLDERRRRIREREGRARAEGSDGEGHS